MFCYSVSEHFSNTNLSLDEKKCMMVLTDSVKQDVIETLAIRVAEWDAKIASKQKLIDDLTNEIKVHENNMNEANNAIEKIDEKIAELNATLIKLKNDKIAASNNKITAYNNYTAWEAKESAKQLAINTAKTARVDAEAFPAEFKPGLYWQRAKGIGLWRHNSSMDDVNYFNTAKIEKYGTVTDLYSVGFAFNKEGVWGNNFYDNGRGDQDYVIELKGYFKPSSTGTWKFYTYSDDSSRLWIGNMAINGLNDSNAVVNNGGLHGMQQRSGIKIHLIENVLYPIRIQMYEWGGGDNLHVTFEGPGVSYRHNGDGFYFNTGNSYDIINMNKYNGAMLARNISNNLHWKRVGGWSGGRVNPELFENPPNDVGLVNDINSIGFAYNRPGVNNVNGGQFAVSILGYFKPNSTGTWNFYIHSDDDSYLWLGSSALKNEASEAVVKIIGCCYGSSGSVTLEKGLYYPLKIFYSNAGGPCNLLLKFSGPNVSERTDGTGFYYNTGDIISLEVVQKLNNLVNQLNKLENELNDATNNKKKYEKEYNDYMSEESTKGNSESKINNQITDQNNLKTIEKNKHNINESNKISKEGQRDIIIRERDDINKDSAGIRYYHKFVLDNGAIPIQDFIIPSTNNYTAANYDAIQNDQFIGNMAKCYKSFTNEQQYNDIISTMSKLYSDNVQINKTRLNNQDFAELKLMNNDPYKFIPVL